MNYKQPEKNEVRNRIWEKAIMALTVSRGEASIVRELELRQIVDWFVAQFKQNQSFSDLRTAVDEELEMWLGFHNNCVGVRKPDELKVLYLCGPEPLNDLEVLLDSGVNSHNVWALTGSQRDHDSAIEQTSRAHIPLKIHCGSLADFFEQFNESFDIIYFDACGPFCGGSPNTLEPLLAIFQRERLRSPGVLITNFCQPSPDECDARQRILDFVVAYFSSRYRDLPRFVHKDGPDPAETCFEPDLLRAFASSRLNELYSEFVTRLIVDLGMNIVPYWRALSMGSLSKNYLSSKDSIAATQASARREDWIDDELPGELHLAPTSYPLSTFIRQLSHYRGNDHVLNLLARNQKDRQGRSMGELIELGSMLTKVIEGHWTLLNEKMLNAVRTSWFDYELRVTCDVPLPNLTVNSLLGIYGRPWFANPRLSDRVTYKAKTQRMFCDLLVLDQCRSYFDWFPVVEAIPARFKSVPFQIVARCILDQIGKHNFQTDTHPFMGSVVATANDRGNENTPEFHEFGERESI